MAQTVVAMVIAFSGQQMVDLITAGDKHAWSTEKILTVGAGCLLSVYSVKLTYDWIQECSGGGEEEGNYSKVATNEADADENEGKKAPYDSGRGKGKWYCCARTDDCGSSAEKAEEGKPEEAPAEEAVEVSDKAQSEIDKAEKARQKTLFVIAFIGSVDDLTLFVPMLVGKGFDTAQLMLGAFCATSLIICFCICIGLCKPIADCLMKIPLAMIVITFATVLLLRGFVFDEGMERHSSNASLSSNMSNMTWNMTETGPTIITTTHPISIPNVNAQANTNVTSNLLQAPFVT